MSICLSVPVEMEGFEGAQLLLVLGVFLHEDQVDGLAEDARPAVQERLQVQR